MENTNAQTQSSEQWQYAGAERLLQGNNWCQYCGQRFIDSERKEWFPDCFPWHLLAPVPLGMPGEQMIVGEWCSKECFLADIYTQVTQGARPEYDSKRRDEK